MFRMSAGTVHTWQDFAKNVGKLSLAGLFLGGSFFLTHAYAATTAQSIATNPHPSYTAMPLTAVASSQR